MMETLIWRLMTTYSGVFIVKGKEDALATKNMVVGESVYGEKRVSVEDAGVSTEYRVWNPFRSKVRRKQILNLCGGDTS